MTDQELKAQLKHAAEQAIEELLAKRSPSQAITLSEIEQLALESAGHVKQAVLEGLSRQAGAARGPADVCCEQCGARMQRKGKRGRYVASTAGEVLVERDYYYCPRCQVGLFPPR